MRTKEEEIRETSTKRKRKSKKMENEYETMCQNSSLGGASFTVNYETNRLSKWKKLLYTRYYLHLGKRNNINVSYKSVVDRENTDIEERYKISTT